MASKLQLAAEKVLGDCSLVKAKAVIKFPDKEVPIDALGIENGDGRVTLLAMSWPQLVSVNGELTNRMYEESQVVIVADTQLVVSRGELLEAGAREKVLDSMIVATGMRTRGLKDNVILGKLLDLED